MGESGGFQPGDRHFPQFSSDKCRVVDPARQHKLALIYRVRREKKMDQQRDNLLKRAVVEGYNPKVEELRRTEYPQLQGDTPYLIGRFHDIDFAPAQA